MFTARTTYGSKISNKKKESVEKVKSENRNEKIILRPNPANNNTMLVLPEDMKSPAVSIINAESKLMWKRSSLGTVSTNINTGNWSNGEYTVIIRGLDKKPITKKLIVQK